MQVDSSLYTIGHSSAEQTFGHKPRSHIDFLLVRLQKCHKKRHDKHAKGRMFREGDLAHLQGQRYSGEGECHDRFSVHGRCP